MAQRAVTIWFRRCVLAVVALLLSSRLLLLCNANAALTGRILIEAMVPNCLSYKIWRRRMSGCIPARQSTPNGTAPCGPFIW